MIKMLIGFFGVDELFSKPTLPPNVKIITPEEQKKRDDEYSNLLENYSYEKNLSEEHLNFLGKIVEDENIRQATIESKLAQIVGQSGIIFALIALFAPLFYENLNSLAIGWKIGVLTLFVIGFFFFLLSIIQATNSFNIRNFLYSRPDLKSVLQKQDRSKEKFIQQIVKDTVSGMPFNVNSNTKKANLLIYSYRSFVVGFISIGLLGAVITSSFLFRTRETSVVVLDEAASVKSLTEQVNKLEIRVIGMQSVLERYLLRSQNAQDSVNTVKLDVQLKEINSELIELKKRILIKKK